jgi:hypothetical protein
VFPQSHIVIDAQALTQDESQLDFASVRIKGMRIIFFFLIFSQAALAAEFSPSEAIRLLRKTSLKATGQTRSAVAASLKSIIFPEIRELEGYTMTEVIAFIAEEIKKHNPNINLIINPNLNQISPNIAPNIVAPPVAQIDPVTGLPMQELPIPNIDPLKKTFIPEDVKIVGLKNKLRNLNALQLIDLICLQFDSPVQFLITDYGVVFFPTPANQVGLSSRALRLNTRVFGEPTNSSPTLGGSKSYKKSLNNQSNMNKSPLNIGAR